MSLHHTQGKGLSMSRKVDHIAVNIYKPDGHGRDTYARMNNGGNTLMNYATAKGQADGCDPQFRLRHGLGRHSHGQQQMSNSPSQKKFAYVQDGSGRDTYILNDNGGFYTDKKLAPYKYTFQERLRHD